MSTSTKNTENIFRAAFDETSQSIQVKVTGSGTITMPNVVELSDGVGPITSTVSGPTRSLDVAVTNTPEILIDASTDSIKIGNGSGNFLGINADGSLDVSSSRSIQQQFSQVTSVASGVLTTILSYTVPSSTTNYLDRVDVSGSNIAMYQVFLNGTLVAVKRTNFGASLNETIDYSSDLEQGFKLNALDNVTVKVLHNRPYVGDFEARLIYAQ